MPLTRLKNEYLEDDGVRFLMADEIGNTVACRVTHEALRDHADRMHFSGTDSAVFEAYRELIEDVASEAFDAEGPFDHHGRVLVISEALSRVNSSIEVVYVATRIFAWGGGNPTPVAGPSGDVSSQCMIVPRPVPSSMWPRMRLAAIRVAINKSSSLRVMSGAFDDSQSLISLVKNLLPSSIRFRLLGTDCRVTRASGS
jgi:hypothetical protein